MDDENDFMYPAYIGLLKNRFPNATPTREKFKQFFVDWWGCGLYQLNPKIQSENDFLMVPLFLMSGKTLYWHQPEQGTFFVREFKGSKK
jgi:hypothetical protein